MTSQPPSLSHRINTATRPVHAHLNALILSLLPLALPPHASTPTLYADGIACFHPVYAAFEGEIRHLQQRTTTTENKNLRKVEIKGFVSRLWLPKLERSERLGKDILHLSPRSCRRRTNSAPASPDQNCSAIDDQQLPPRLRSFVKHIQQSTSAKPHLLLAYTWILYMALFSGGRHIRRALRHAGPGFWNNAADPVHHRNLICGHDHKVNPDYRGEKEEHALDLDQAPDRSITFWTFSSSTDGEDIKADFKRRFHEIDSHLHETEREDVIEEAVFIMRSMIGIVEEIAEAVDANAVKELAGGKRAVDSVRKTVLPNQQEPSIQWLPLKHILPMGLAELLTGAAKAVSILRGPRFAGMASRQVGVES